MRKICIIFHLITSFCIGAEHESALVKTEPSSSPVSLEDALTMLRREQGSLNDQIVELIKTPVVDEALVRELLAKISRMNEEFNLRWQ